MGEVKRGERYSWFALGLLFIVALFNYVDRNIFSIMQIQVQRELGLSDTQLGTLTGIAFALFYTTAALPLARLADRVSRKLILLSSLTIWTLMTALGGFATGFGMLLVCRIGVALGEAGCVPASHSMISDLFDRHRRALALAVWCLAIPIGSMLGFAVGGLTAWVGWRSTFFIVGLAGLALVPVLFIFLKEPARGTFEVAAADGSKSTLKIPLRGAVSRLWRTKSFRYLLLGDAILAITKNGTMAWNAPFYSRVHDMPISQIAVYLALIAGVAGGLGTFFGGALAQRLGNRDERWFMRTPAIAILSAVPLLLAQYSVADPRISLGLGFLATVLLNASLGPVNAISQSLMPAAMRAFTAAVLLFAVGIVGLGTGPTLIGILSDTFASAGRSSQEALRFAIQLTIGTAVVGAALFLAASRHLPKDLKASGEILPDDPVPGGALTGTA